jgi:hypothetical protein
MAIKRRQGEQRSVAVLVRLTPAEREEIRAAANALDVPMAQYARHTLLRAAKQAHNPFAEPMPR